MECPKCKANCECVDFVINYYICPKCGAEIILGEAEPVDDEDQMGKGEG